MTFNKNISIFLLVSAFFCQSNTINLPEDNYTIAEVYCWCFGEIKTVAEKKSSHFYMSHCTTFQPVKPEDLINDKNKITITKNKKSIQSLSRIFNKTLFKTNALGETPDCRFVILFTKNDGSKDTFYTRNEARFYLGKDKLKDYNFNVIDSVRKIMAIKKFECAKS